MLDVLLDIIKRATIVLLVLPMQNLLPLYMDRIAQQVGIKKEISVLQVVLVQSR